MLEKIADYLWHIALPVTAMALGSFATSTFLTKNSFLEEIRKQYVQTARMKGLTERQVLYGHVFRNAMLIVISGFPGAFIARLLHRLAADRERYSRSTDSGSCPSNRSSTATIRSCSPISIYSPCSASS